MEDSFDLQRFVDAQDRGGTYAAAIRELRAGRKESHWMWFVFPQIAGLGRSSMAQQFAISGLDEARAFLSHPVLGSRLRECAEVIDALPGTDAVHIFGSIDAQKLRSSMTLFSTASPDDAVFARVLGHYFAGEADEATRTRLGLTR
jgi:uncharacterized protein (DUF1810 family)